MIFLKVKIIKYASYEQPGFVLCKFNDAYGKEWEITEKVPILTSKDLIEENLPTEGFFIAGEVIFKKNNMVIFSTKKPWYISTDSGETTFEVFEHQLSHDKTE